MKRIIQINEPKPKFGFGQELTHPPDGLSLFGPYTQTVGGLRFGVIGSPSGVKAFNRWVYQILRYIPAYSGSKFRRSAESKHGKLTHSFYPGFESAFALEWNMPAEIVCEIPLAVLKDALAVHERHTRVARVVKTYTKRLIRLNYDSENKPDLWFVVIPKQVFLLCRPMSEPPKDYAEGTRAEDAAQFDLFLDREETDSFAEEYQESLRFKPDFHNQLKARLLKHQIITQVLQEETLDVFMRAPNDPIRDKQDAATIAWNLTTSIYYKTRRRPWILSDPRPGVCYMGLVFKRLNKSEGEKNACCGAQMFLEDGHGMVFKGALGPWYSADLRECHLSREEAARLLERAIQSYADEHDGNPPNELFVHGGVRFDDAEWGGFSEVAARHNVKLVGVRIRKVYDGLKIFTLREMPVSRGTALQVSDKKAFLWTTGFTPRLNTYPGWNVPNPLDVEICNGDADVNTVLEDILRLTKLNYNSCSFSDGLPITLKFASKVGDILTTAPFEDDADTDSSRKPLPFWHYI